ncbi:hypothetical protein FRC01_001664 [Tulasnella sp. 417]|nr:hypothetical protein FRC01_001664 [Tulasnella sp. 417]
MFEGSVQHEDSAGHKGTIGPGDLQWMIAVGLFEIDRVKETSNAHNYLDRVKEAPSYQELVSSQVPTAYPLGPDGPAEVKVISGKSFGVESPVRHLGGCWYLDIKLKADGEGKAEFFQDIPPGWTAFLYTIDGVLRVNNESIDKHYTVVLSAEENEAGILLSLDGDQDARAVLIAGAPLNQPVFQYGPFVMNSKEEIMATLRDYDGQRNGFEKSKTWKSSIGGR